MFDSYAETFERRAESYQTAMQRLPRVRDAEFAAMLAPLDGMADGLLCDIPSGGGYLAAFLPPGMIYLGVEPVDGFFIDMATGPADRIRAPIDQVPLPDASVDYVVSLAGLHHEADLSGVFGEIRRLVRPGGRVVLSDVAADTPPARFLNGFVAAHNPQGHDGRFLDSATRAAVEAAGMTVVDDEMIAVPWRFDRRDDVVTFCRALFGLRGVDDDNIFAALADEIGFDTDGTALLLRWTLRRMVCEPA